MRKTSLLSGRLMPGMIAAVAVCGGALILTPVLAAPGLGGKHTPTKPTTTSTTYPTSHPTSCPWHHPTTEPTTHPTSRPYDHDGHGDFGGHGDHGDHGDFGGHGHH